MNADDFAHPQDKAALQTLRAIPAFTPCVEAFMKVLQERQLYGLNMAEKIRLGPQQLPELYQHLPPACMALGIAEPEFYLQMNHEPNAYTYGNTRIAITVTSGLVEMLNEDELRAVIAHECGHIACHHVLYHTMAHLLLEFGAAMGNLAKLAYPIEMALFAWSRRSELSADRAAALVMGTPDSMVNVMIRLAGGPRSITQNINVDLYIQQADAYDELTESTWDQFLQFLAIKDRDHPFMAVRAREIVHWCQTPEFTALQKRLKEEPVAAPCAKCSAALRPEWKFCQKCGELNPNYASEAAGDMETSEKTPAPEEPKPAAAQETAKAEAKHSKKEKTPEPVPA